MDSTSLRVCCAVIAFVSGGCAETLPVPPSRLAVNDTPGTVGGGNLEVGGGIGVAGSVFNGTAPSANATVTYGLRDDLDLRADASGGVILVEETYGVNRVSGFGMARLGIERNVVPGVFSLVAGVGGGGTRAGGFLSIDAGFVLGFENRYVSPFAGAVLHGGVPITSPTLVITEQEDGSPPTVLLREAYASFGFVGSVGVRIPFGGHRDGTPHRHAFQLSLDVGGSYGDDPAIDEGELERVLYNAGTFAYRVLLAN